MPPLIEQLRRAVAGEANGGRMPGGGVGELTGFHIEDRIEERQELPEVVR